MLEIALFITRIKSNLLSWSPESRWGYSTSDIGVGLDLLEEPSIGTPEPDNDNTNNDLPLTPEPFNLNSTMLEDLPEINLKIAKARPAVPGSWAWVAQIKYFRNGRYEFVCAGTLVADQWVLTAAQCLSDQYVQILKNNLKIMKTFQRIRSI